MKKNNEFFIYMKNPPQYDASKPYYEQTKEVLDFFTEEQRKLTEGITIDGVFIHPWLYWHLNYFITPIPTLIEGSDNETEEVDKLPPLDDHIWYFLENFKRCKPEQKGLFIFGTRGLAKSTILASMLTWISTFKENGVSQVIGGADKDLSDIGDLLKKGFNQAYPAFRLPKNKQDWNKKIEFGVKDKRRNSIPYSSITITNANKGTGKSSEKGAGGSPVGFILDEAGKWNFLKILQSAFPGFRTQYGLKTFPIISGTGGNNSLSKDAKKVLRNPENHQLLKMDWNILNSMVPKEFRTWNEKVNFGIFAPGQMSYRLDGVKKIKTNLADFLGVKSSKLAKIPMFVTDWEAANKFIHEERERLKGDENELNKFKMYHPITPEECFLEATINPFPVAIARKHLDYLIDTGKVGKPVSIYRDSDAWAKQEFSEKPIAGYPFEDGLIDSPYVMYSSGTYGFPDATRPPRALYVAGFDGYKQNEAEYTDSLGSCYILQRRNTDVNTPCERIVC